jgi:hypothetical protein
MNVDAAVAIMLIAGLGVLFFGPWQTLCTDYARQVAFEKRDAIFDMASEGRLNFQSHEYRTIRTSLEQLIRFAHTASLTSFLLQSQILSKQTAQHSRSDLSKAVSAIRDPDTKQEVQALVWRAQYAMLVMMLAKSPYGVLLAGGVLLMRYLQARLPAPVSRMAVPVAEKMQIEAEHFRSDANAGFALAA